MTLYEPIKSMIQFKFVDYYYDILFHLFNLIIDISVPFSVHLMPMLI